MILMVIIQPIMSAGTIQVSIATAKRDLSQLANQVVYGGKRVVVTSRGKPKFAIVDLAELEQEMLDKAATTTHL